MALFALVALTTAAVVTPSTTREIVFREVPPAFGIDYELAPNKPGIAVGDYDGDGWLDVCVCGGSLPRPQIFRNRGERVHGPGGLVVQGWRPWFERVTPRVMPQESRVATLAYFTDFDNDHDADLLVVRRYGQNDWQDTGLMRFENVGGRYELLGPQNGVGRFGTAVGGLALADLENDGDLDIVFLHSIEGNVFGGPGYVFANDLVPDLRDVTASFGGVLELQRGHYGCVFADFTGNGLVDLHVAVTGNLDLHFRNNGDGTFTNANLQAGTTHIGQDMGLAVGDIENDGDLDIFSSNINHGALYVNDGTGRFTDEAIERGIAYGDFKGLTYGWGTTFADFDHDGDVDLVVVANVYGPAELLENDGTGHFTIATKGSGLDLFGHSVVAFDYDRDGDQDLLVADETRLRLYENRTPALAGRHWLIVKLQGVQSNSEGVGARIDVTAGGRTLTRTIMIGDGYLSGSPTYAHFGLGDAAVVDTLTVRWPSGLVQTLRGVAADRYLVVKEGA